MNFSDLKLHPDLLNGLDAMNFRETTPIQELAIPHILAKRDMIACAQTGTGKTAAYLLPVIHNILATGHKGLNTLVLAPTRELAQQIDQQLDGFSYFVDISSISIYGGGDGSSWDQQRKALDEGVDIIIATPGRLLSFLTLGKRQIPSLKHLVLDEADRMLDMGFYDDIIKIVKNISSDRQTLLFSATMPPKIRKLAKSILNDPEEINIAISKPAAGITQTAYMTYDNQKEKLLKDILQDTAIQSAIIFASTKDKVKQLDQVLRQAKIAAKAFHSDLDQSTREEYMRKFKNRDLRILIGTDVLSRGIDIEEINLILNFDVPPDPEDYVHRVGRTARADKKGTAITFINERDMIRFNQIEALIGYEVVKKELPKELGSGPQYKIVSKSSSSGKKHYSKGNKIKNGNSRSGNSNRRSGKPRNK